MNCPEKYKLIELIINDLEEYVLYDKNGEEVLVVLIDDWDGSTGSSHLEIRKENKNYEEEMKAWKEILARQQEEQKKQRAKDAYNRKKLKKDNEHKEYLRLKKKFDK